MSKTLAFIVLVLVASVAGLLGIRANASFFSDIWSQVFWLAIGTLATVFILDKILERAEQARRIRDDAFAFRTFVANMLAALAEMVDARYDFTTLFQSALINDREFSDEVKVLDSSIKTSDGFLPNVHMKYYLDVSSGLRDLSRNFIRLFSKNESEMLTQYQSLNDLASQWKYMDEFHEDSREHTETLPVDDPNRIKRERKFQESLSVARSVVIATSSKLSELASKNAIGDRNPN